MRSPDIPIVRSTPRRREENQPNPPGSSSHPEVALINPEHAEMTEWIGRPWTWLDVSESEANQIDTRTVTKAVRLPRAADASWFQQVGRHRRLQAPGRPAARAATTGFSPRPHLEGHRHRPKVVFCVSRAQDQSPSEYSRSSRPNGCDKRIPSLRWDMMPARNQRRSSIGSYRGCCARARPIAAKGGARGRAGPLQHHCTGQTMGVGGRQSLVDRLRPNRRFSKQPDSFLIF